MINRVNIVNNNANTISLYRLTVINCRYIPSFNADAYNTYLLFTSDVI